MEANTSGIVNLLRTVHDACGGVLAFAVLPGDGPATGRRDVASVRDVASDDHATTTVIYPPTQMARFDPGRVLALVSNLRADPEFAEGRVVVRMIATGFPAPGDADAVPLVLAASKVTGEDRSGILGIAAPLGEPFDDDISQCLGGLAARLSAHLAARRAVLPTVSAMGVRPSGALEELTRRARRLVSAVAGTTAPGPWTLVVVAVIAHPSSPPGPGAPNGQHPQAPISGARLAETTHEWLRYGDPMVAVGEGEVATVVLVAPGSTPEAVTERLAGALTPAFGVGQAGFSIVDGTFPAVAGLLEMAVGAAHARASVQGR